MPKQKIKLSQLRWLWLALVIGGLDQLTKSIISNKLMLHESISLTSFFNFTLIYNEGAAFGFLHNAGGWQQVLFAVVAVLVSAIIIFWLSRMRQSQYGLAIALVLILGGALGNLWDRIYLGYVVDFIDLHYQQWHWPAFNIADSAICVGAVMLILEIFKREEKPKP